MKPSIFPYERRDVIAREKAKWDREAWLHSTIRFAGLLFFLILMAAHLLGEVRSWSDAEAHGPEPVVLVDRNEVPLSSFCRQAVLDHETWGRDLSPDLQHYCGL